VQAKKSAVNKKRSGKTKREYVAVVKEFRVEEIE
jgi:hypothetical protein